MAEGTGLHTRPEPDTLHPHFPDVELVSTAEYASTFLPNRRGEDFAALKQRSDTFVEAFVRRVEKEYPDVRTVVLVCHAGTVISIGRSVSRPPRLRSGRLS